MMAAVCDSKSSRMTDNDHNSSTDSGCSGMSSKLMLAASTAADTTVASRDTSKSTGVQMPMVIADPVGLTVEVRSLLAVPHVKTSQVAALTAAVVQVAAMTVIVATAETMTAHHQVQQHSSSSNSDSTSAGLKTHK